MIGTDLVVQLDSRRRADLEDMASRLRCTPGELVGRAVDDLIELDRWQRARIEDGIAAAAAGDFATDEELAAVVKG